MIVVLAGVSGSGKTTVGALLAGCLGWPFTDGDLLHPAANIAKMSRGVPLTDADREPWLRAIAAVMDERIAAAESAVLACSALKRAYRDLLLVGRPAARLVFLAVDRDVAARRLAARHGHFFDPDLLDSQFATLEPPGADERSVVVVRVSDRPEETAGEIAGRLGLGPRDRGLSDLGTDASAHGGASECQGAGDSRSAHEPRGAHGSPGAHGSRGAHDSRGPHGSRGAHDSRGAGDAGESGRRV